jgi:hypothetical protein
MLEENIEYPLDNLPPRLWGKNIFETLEIKTPPQIVKCEILVQHYFFKQTQISFFWGKILGNTQIVFGICKNNNQTTVYFLLFLDSREIHKLVD